MRASRTVRVGIGGWTYEPWRGPFYPDGLPHKRELAHAAGRLATIEVNGTFYRAQSPDTFTKWRDETPDDFVFALKAPRYATNRRVLAEGAASIERFVTGGIAELGPKLGPINWQFAPTKQFEPDDFEAFLKLLPTDVGGLRLRHAVEVRHPSFRDPAFLAMARAHDVAVVLAGDSDHVQIADPTAPFVYARIMGTREGEPLGYGAAALDLWAQRADIFSRGGVPDGLDLAGPTPPREPRGRDVFVFVISGHKVSNPAAAEALAQRLRRG